MGINFFKDISISSWIVIISVILGLLITGFYLYKAKGKLDENRWNLLNFAWKFIGIIASACIIVFIINIQIITVVKINTDELKNKLDSINTELQESRRLTMPPFYDSKENRGKYDKAREYYDLGKYDEAVSILSNISDNESDILYVYYWLGENYFALKDYKKASEYFKQITDDYKIGSTISSQKKLSSVFMLARCYEKMKDYKNARIYYKRLDEASKYNFCQPIFDIAKRKLRR